jgi:large subunit ribosomal protein L35
VPKVKTRKFAADRFRITKTGKILRRKTRESHIRNWKSAKRKRHYHSDDLVSSADRSTVRRALGA